MVAGARDNQLVGYGLVAGLAGDGDKDQIYTKQTIANMLQRYGINVQPPRPFPPKTWRWSWSRRTFRRSSSPARGLM